MSEVLLTQEVGSLPKPNWRVAFGPSIDEHQIEEAVELAGQLDIDPEYVACKLRFWSSIEGHNVTAMTKVNQEASRKALAAKFAVRRQEKVGLDIINDGEQGRNEMYEDAVRRTDGFQSRGRVRVFDDKTFHKFAVVEELSLPKPWHTDEIERLKELTDHTIKHPFIGPYTIVDWSFNEYYRGDREAFLAAVTDDVIRPNIEAALALGIEWVQIDEPAAGAKAREIPLFVNSFNRATHGLLGKFSIHLCFSDWEKFIPHIGGLENCHQLSIEFANRDGQELGTKAGDRPAYEVLKDIHRELPDVAIGLGVVTVHENTIEPPELVRDRILRAVDIVDDPALIYPSPDCGLRTRSQAVAYAKLQSVVRGTELAKLELGV